MFERIDGGPCRAAATWVSEKYYGGWGDVVNSGDSWVAMGRHAWYDSLSRFRFDDKQTFDDLIYAPLQDQLLENTWMHEVRLRTGLMSILRRKNNKCLLVAETQLRWISDAQQDGVIFRVPQLGSDANDESEVRHSGENLRVAKGQAEEECLGYINTSETVSNATSTIYFMNLFVRCS